MPWNQNQLQLRKLLDDLTECVQTNPLFGILGATAKPYRRTAIGKSEGFGPSKHLGVLSVVVRPIKFDVPNDVYFRRIITQRDESIANRVALRSDPIYFAYDAPDQWRYTTIALQRFLAKTAIDHGYRNLPLRGDRDPIGPKLQFGQDQQIWLDAIEGPADCPSKIQRGKRYSVLVVEFLGQFIARVG